MIIGNRIILRDKKLADAPDDYAWQADPELAYLDAAPALNTTFTRYLSEYTSQLRYLSPNRHQFAIDTLEGKHIGNCSFYGINETKGEAELGIMIGNRDYWDKAYGTDAITTLLSYIFRQTKLKRIYLKTLVSNNRAQQCFRKCGFSSYERRDRGEFKFVFMETHREQWEKANKNPRKAPG